MFIYKGLSFFLKKKCTTHHSTWVLAALLLPMSVAAQSVSDTTVALAEGVVIQATRTGADAPIPHTNFSAQKIAAQYHAQDVPMLLTSVPSLVETSDAGAGIGYSGMRIRGSDPTRINVTLNGVPLNDAESQGVFWVNLPDLAASAAEIQVQRGVGTSTNGAGAFGATVNVNLSRVEPEPTATFTQTLGSFGTNKQSAYLHTGLLRERWALSGRLSRIESAGYVDRASARLRSLHLIGTYLTDRQSVQLQVLSGHERTYQAWYGLPAQLLAVDSLRTYNPAGTERADRPHPDEVDNYTQRHVLLHVRRQLSPRLHLQLNGHYTRGFGFFEQYKNQQSLPDYGMRPLLVADTSLIISDLVRRRWLDNHFGGGTWLLRWQAGGGNELSVGGAASEYRGAHFGEVVWAQLATAPSDHRYYDNDATKRDLNFFVKNETRLGTRHAVFVDLQVRHVAYRFLGFDAERQSVEQRANLTFFNPKIGITSSLARGTQAYAYAGVGHREPNRDDYTQSTPASRPCAERLVDVELGVRTRHARWSAAANGYGMWYRDQLVLDGRINDVGAYIRTNVPRSHRLGVELEASAQPLSALWLEGNVSVGRHRVVEFVEYRDDWATGAQVAKVHRRTPLAFSPGVTAQGGVTWAFFQKNEKNRLALTATGKYVGAQYLDNTGNAATRLPAFGWADVRLKYDLLDTWTRRVSLLFSVQNVLDARYVSNGWVYRFESAGYDPRPDDPYVRSEGGDVYHQAGFFPQAGRHWMLTVQVEF
jgi:iron complex outermembrane recepter protein